MLAKARIATPIVLILLSLLLMLQATSVYNADIGLPNDALWDFAPAVGMLQAASQSPSLEILVFGYPLPLVSGPYSGAWKIWILAPLLMLFGTSSSTVLVLNVLFGLLYLLALYWALLPSVGANWAQLVFLIPLVDANYVLTVPLDNGIFLTQCVFICLTLGALFRFYSDCRQEHLWMAWFFNGCLLAQKLTSIPIVLGIAAVTSGLSYRRFRRVAREQGVTRALTHFVALPAAAFVLPLIPHLIYFHQSGLKDLFTMTSDGRRGAYFTGLGHCFAFFSRMFDGADWYQRITLAPEADAATAPVLATVGFALIAGSSLIYLMMGGKKGYGRHTAVLVAIGLCSFLFYPAFKGLDRPWHYYVLSPMFYFGLVTGLAHVVTSCIARCKRYAPLIVTTCAVAVTIGVGLGAAHSLHVLARIHAVKGVCTTSPGINEFYHRIARSNVRTVYTVNYSLAYPIYVYSRGSIQTEEMAWTDLTDENIEDALQRIESDPEAAIAYRYCGDKSVEPDWIQWLNREPGISEVIGKVKSEAENLTVTRDRDDRQTEFVLIRRNRRAAARPTPPAKTETPGVGRR